MVHQVSAVPNLYNVQRMVRFPKIQIGQNLVMIFSRSDINKKQKTNITCLIQYLNPNTHLNSQKTRRLSLRYRQILQITVSVSRAPRSQLHRVWCQVWRSGLFTSFFISNPHLLWPTLRLCRLQFLKQRAIFFLSKVSRSCEGLGLVQIICLTAQVWLRNRFQS